MIYPNDLTHCFFPDSRTQAYHFVQDILKEINMMRQCESDYVVKYYGSYFKHNDLWIVMEYCAARSVSDIMRLIKRPFEEDKIQTILYYTLKGKDRKFFSSLD